MYKIREERDERADTLMIPAMLDVHFPLLKYTFYSPRYAPVILENEKDIIATGLRYVHNDMCFPCILNVGQMIDALQSGVYDPKHTLLLMPSAGDACRGANYTEILRKAVEKAGFADTKVLSLNVQKIDVEHQMHIEWYMVWRGLFGLYYGDMLLLLTQQTRPYEAEHGAADACYWRWVEKLSEDLKQGRHMTLGAMKRNFKRMAADFAAIPRTGEKKQRIGLVGELYIRYCHLGNRNMVKYLEESGCESYTNGLSWYALYYVNSHFSDGGLLMRLAGKVLYKFMLHIQKVMLSAIREAGLFALPDFAQSKAEVQKFISTEGGVGDGWLIGMEATAYLRHGIPKVLAVQPFGCMPSHVFGRGQYASLARRLGGQIVSIDFDSGSSEVNILNRARLLIDGCFAEQFDKTEKT